MQPTVAVTADSRDAVRLLLEVLSASSERPADRAAEFTSLRETKRDEIDQWLQPHRDYLAAIRRALPRDGYFVDDVSQIGFSSYFSFPVDDPRHFITYGYQGNLGYGFPTALGVKAAHRDSAVVSVTGDGGFQFAIQELATAVQYELGVVVVVFDNSAYGNVKADQARIYGDTVVSNLVNPDFVALAHAYGARGYVAESPRALEVAVDGITSGRPTVVVVPMPLSTEVSPWPYLMPSGEGDSEGKKP